MNDPNGLVYHNGLYHLFYQYNPFGNTWGNMSWGHATSTDLLHWQEQPLAIPNDVEQDIFSGSVVVDTNNTSGLGGPGQTPLVAIFTSNYKAPSPRNGTQAQSLAYSLDNGQTWTKYSGNPVLTRNTPSFRDPKVFWYDSPQGGYWVMVAVEAMDHKVLLYKSTNLKNWDYLSDFGPENATGGQWECPDLFPLPVDGNPANTKWVMTVNINPGGVAGGSAGQYFVGTFDGTTFHSETSYNGDPLPAGTRIADFNGGNYQGWTVSNEPGNWLNGPFGSAPATGTLPNQNPVSGFAGTGLVNSFVDGDWPLGRMESPSFTVNSQYINFLVGGGRHPRISNKLDNNPPAGDLLFNGFEVPDGTTLANAGWTGTADLAPNFQPATVGGDYYIGAKRVNTYETGGAPGDDRQGTLTSPEFTVTRNFMSMLVGGGNRSPESGQTLQVELLINGNVVRTLAGDNQGALNWKGWDVSQFLGQQARIRVVDQATGPWGHLTLDHIMLTDQSAVPRSDETTVNLVVDGQVVRTATGSDSEVLDWASWDVAEFTGRQAKITIVDNNRFGWGHILADEFFASPEPARKGLENYEWLDWGRDFYASVSFNNVPDGKRIMLGWMNNWDYGQSIPTSPWRSAMALPREVSLAQTPAGPRLVQKAVDQMATLAGPPSYTQGAGPMTAGTQPLPSSSWGQTQRVDITFSPGTAATAGLRVMDDDGANATVIGYDAGTAKLFVDRRNSGNTSFSSAFPSVESTAVARDANGDITLRIYLDRSSVEVFAQGGTHTITDQVFPVAGANRMALFATGGTAQLKSLTVTPLAAAMFQP
ncbi:GH32 C-terminal domain-containing protein [Arthrobacter sp. M4]|uniref:GH32 C-terminal domain-containing protein n=1 Tax=Arthrobacter sp. M4 TaxID=218160 RepID=UPI0035ABDE4B